MLKEIEPKLQTILAYLKKKSDIFRIPDYPNRHNLFTVIFKQPQQRASLKSHHPLSLP